MSETLKIEGYASLFGRKDLSGDCVKRGAFAASLLRQAGQAMPMLLNHETAEPIGVWERIAEDTHGLFVSGCLLVGDERSRRTLRLIQAGALSGLSIGYRAKRSRPNASEGRDLLEIDLWEVSIVAFPMLREARLSFSQSETPSFLTA